MFQVEGAKIGKVSNLLKDVFTDADTLCVVFPPCCSSRDKILLLAATILIDYMFFES